MFYNKHLPSQNCLLQHNPTTHPPEWSQWRWHTTPSVDTRATETLTARWECPLVHPLWDQQQLHIQEDPATPLRHTPKEPTFTYEKVTLSVTAKNYKQLQSPSTADISIIKG